MPDMTAPAASDLAAGRTENTQIDAVACLANGASGARSAFRDDNPLIWLPDYVFDFQTGLRKGELISQHQVKLGMFAPIQYTLHQL